MELGKIHVFTGNGKGKTTSSIGFAIRALARGYKVYFIQLLKKQKTGEEIILSKLQNIVFKKFGSKKFIVNKNILKEHLKEIEKAKKYIFKILKNKKIDILILDELNIILYYNLITITEVKEIINICKEKKIELIITGRYANKELIKIADLVTEMKEIKHYFKTTKARKGIEY